MLDQLSVKDVYITLDNYPNISMHAPIGEAFLIMHHILEEQAQYRTILVLDDEDHLKGYLSVLDMVRAVGPDYLNKKSNFEKNQIYFTE